MTVRFTPELREFVRAEGRDHVAGASGVINAAVEHYMRALARRRQREARPKVADDYYNG